MSETSYYVYALKDPRTSPARAFYIGKGTGSRAYDHLLAPDATRKGQRIRDIEAMGVRPLVTPLVDGLSEIQAIRIEAELIAAFGLEGTGGALTNAVIPTGVTLRAPPTVVVPAGAPEKAQLGLALLKDAVLELARANRGGITNSEAARALGLRSDHGGGSKDYLSYSVLGLLLREGKLIRDPRSKRHRSQVE